MIELSWDECQLVSAGHLSVSPDAFPLFPPGFLVLGVCIVAAAAMTVLVYAACE